MLWSRLLWATVTGICALPGIARPEGLFYRLPADGSWVRFDANYTFQVAAKTSLPDHH